jgi:hypothetical protein
MVTISYENGVFKIIDLSLALEKLYYYLNQQKDIKESSLVVSKIVIDPIVFKFVILDLIRDRKGIKTFCKNCDAEYYPDQIKVEKIGTYPEIHSPKEKGNIWKWMKGLLGREKLEMKIGRFGGERIICPKGHELLTVVKWIA